jgi:hypothetical protein
LRRRSFGLARESTSSWWRQDQILEDKVVAGATGVNKDANEQIEKAQHRRGRISAGILSRQKLDANRARSIWVRDPDRLLPPYTLKLREGAPHSGYAARKARA